MEHPGKINISEYHYHLPPDRIAQFPLNRRDESKLLIYQKGRITSDIFKNLPEYFPPGSRLIFNETKVIPARIFFQKLTGARIEVFCLEPSGLVSDYQMALQQGPGCQWKCFIGNARRWKGNELQATLRSGENTVILRAEKISRENDHFVIRFDWEPGVLSFSEILEIFGKIPLPPYINRETEDSDLVRYQTVFAKTRGSIAAPTAGLHFTEEMIRLLHEKQIGTATINLHVGAGTFKPVSSLQLSGHAMHAEYVRIPANVIRLVLDGDGKKNILVGTTTVRTLESLYWLGARWLLRKPDKPVLKVTQWEPYEIPESRHPPVKEALEAVLHCLADYDMDAISGRTSLMIAPGYTYKIPDAIITNFHLPQSTLLLLVSAFIGQDWKIAYQYALDNNFRFLSYGDSCLFIK